MSTTVSKSRSPVERSYSSASSTTSSRRSGRRKRRRMKHTVMPLKKRAGRHEVPCDVHRVSNLDHEEMEQSACFWVAKNIDDPTERKFKEDVFVNKDQDSSDDEMSYLDDTKQSITSGEYQHDSRSETHEVRTESRQDTKYIHEEKRFDVDEKENNANYANEDKATDANYSEEKTFYGVRKSKITDGNDLERVSPLPSPRNRSRMSSYSDDGQSGFSSEGMRVGWTSDVGASSGPEYSAMTDESDGEGGHKRTRRGSKEFYGYRKSGDKSEFPTRKIRERNNNEDGVVVVATDITATKTTEVENFPENYEKKDHFEETKRENIEVDREYYTKEEIERSRYSAYNGRDVTPGINRQEEYDPRVSDPRQYEPSEEVNGEDYDVPINAQGEYEPRVSDHSYHDPPEHFPHDARGPGGKTSTPAGNVHPSSDTELVNFRSFDIEVERYSDRSLPLGGHKTKTQYYSVEDLIRATQEEEGVEKVPGDGSDDGPEIPRVGEYENYIPPQETREDDPATRGPHAGDQQVQPDESEKPRVVPSTYEVKTQRPLLVPRRDRKTDSRDKDDLSPRDGTPETDEHSGTYEESKDFYGYRRTQVDELENENKENVRRQYSNEKGSGRPTKEKRDEYKSPGTNREFDNQDQDQEMPKDNRALSDDDRQFQESKEFYGYRQSRTGGEPHDVRQRYDENKGSGDQSKTTQWQETKEFYGYRTSRTGSKENLLNENEEDNRQPQKWEQNQEFYGYRESKTGNGFARPEDDMKQTNSNTRNTKTFKESREFYGFRSFGSSENISKGSRDGQVWEESKEFFGFRRKVVDGQIHFAEHHDRPGSPSMRKIEEKPLYLESADDKRERNTSGKKNLPDDKRPYDKRPPYQKPPPYEKRPPHQKPRPYDKQHPYDKQRPYDKRPPYEKPPPMEKPPEERIEKSQEQDNLMSVDDGQEPGNKFEESREFYGYRPPEQLPRSAAYEQYIPPGERKTTRDYEEKSTRYTERQTRETNVTEHKRQASEPEIRDTRTNDVYMQPDDVPGEPTGKYDPATRYGPTGEDDSSDMPRDRHMFNILEIPSSKKVIPLVSDIAPDIETTQTTTTETKTSKRLHTRSQRDNLRREASQPEQTEPDSSDVGMKMFRQRSLPRKHGLPTSPEEKNKELPSKITKKSDEPELSQVDPDFANKFREITEKRKPEANKTTKTTETTTKGAAESGNKNVEELVNVFNTLEHIQKTTDKKTDRTVQPRQVKKIVKGESLDKPEGKQNNLSPESTVSQKLNEIEGILDSVDKNTQRGTRHKPGEKDKPTHRRDERDTSSLTRKTRETYTTRETRETRKERETRETRERHGWKPRTPDEQVTKQEEMSVESFLDDDEPMLDEHDRRGKPTGEEPLDRSPHRTDRRPRGYDVTRSRDDDDEIYQAQMRKSREESWRDTRKSRKKKYDSKSDGEIEGFKSTPFGDRVITPGTPVNIRLYGLNLQKSKDDRSQDLNWELLSSEVPVDESVGRTQLRKQPFDVEQMPDTQMPVDESVDRTAVNVQPLDVEQMPGDEPRTEEPTIDRSHVRPTDVNVPPQTMKDLSMREQEEPLYRRQERLPRKRDAPVAKSDSLDDDQVTSQVIKWSHAPVSKVRSEKEPSSKMPRSESPTTPSEQFLKDKKPQEELPFEKYPSKENLLQELPSEIYPSTERPYEKQPYDKRPYKRRPLEESPEDIEIPVEKIQETDKPDGQVIEIEYTDDEDDENKLAEQDNLPGHNTLYEKSTQRSSTPKLRSPKKSDDVLDDSCHTTHEESTERHESTSHESSKGVDTTIHTTRTTKTTRTETTETTVKTIRKSGSEFYRPDSQSTPASGEPEYKLPVRDEPEYSSPDHDNAWPDRRYPDETDFTVPVKSEPDVYTEPDYTGPEQMAPPSKPDTEEGEPQSGDEPSLVATEFIVLNNDTGRPINVTMLGRLEENDDDDYLSSQSREDLFLHTRLKMVTENKKRTTRKPEDSQLLEAKPADQDDLDNEGSLTSSDDEFNDEDVSEQLLIPISGKINEKIKKQDRPRYVLPQDDDFTQQTQVDEPVSKTDQPTREDITQDSVGNVFIPRVPHEPDLEREHAPTKAMPDFDGFEEPISEKVLSTEKPGVVLEFGEPVENVPKVDDIEIVEIPIFEDFSVESAPQDDSSFPSGKPSIDEKVSKERTDTPTLPDLKHVPVDENVTSEKQDKNLNIPAIPEVKPVEPVDESVPPSTQTAREIYIPDLEEVLPEIRRPPTPTLVDETVTPEQRKIEIELPQFMATRPSQPIDEDVIQSEPIEKQVYVPDFSELIPEPDKPILPVDENVTAERRDNQLELPEFQIVEPERRSSEPITEEVSADEPIKSEVFIPDFAEEFQDVVPEYPESGITNEDRDIPVIVEKDEKDGELPDFQEAEEEPHRNFRITDSDVEVEAPSSTDSGVSEKIVPDKYDSASPEKTPEKVPYEKDIYEKDTYGKDTYEKNTVEDETWSETRKTVKETRTTETVTVEKTITKHVSEVSEKEEPVSPRSPRKDKPLSPKAVHFSSSIEPKESSGSSSEPSPRSSFGSAAEGPTRKRRSRRGNRFDELKRSGPLVPDSVVRDESPMSTSRGFSIPPSNVPRVASPVVAEKEQPVSNAPDSFHFISFHSQTPFFTPREKLGQLCPEMYLLDSDDDTPGGDSTKPDEKVVAELDFPEEEVKIPEEENVPGEDEIPVRDVLSPELIDELLEKEIQGLAEDDKSLDTSEVEPEVEEMISQEKQTQPQLEYMPDETPKIDENVLAKETLKKDDDDSPAEVIEEIEKELHEDKPEFLDEEDGKLPEEEIEKALDKEKESSTSEEEPDEIDENVSKSLDERVPGEIILPEPAREETLESEVPDEVPEKSGRVDLEDFEVIVIERLSDKGASDKDDGSTTSDEGSEKSDDVSEKPDDIIPKDDDDVYDKVDDEMSKRDFPGGVTTEEESTVETVIVEKSHSEVTVTEITTTTRYPSSPQDTPSKTSDIPEEPKESSSDNEDQYVIIPTNLEKPDEIIKPCEVETVEGIPNEQPTLYNDQPTTNDDKAIPYLVITEEPKVQQTSDSDSSSSDSESSTIESDDERTDSDKTKVVSTGIMAEEPNQPTETVFGIVDINYEKLQTEEVVIVEKTVESLVDIDEPITKISTDKELLIVVMPEEIPTHEEVPKQDDVPEAPEEVPKKEITLLEVDIDIVPDDEESTSSSDEDEDQRVSTETSETTVETLIVEKTSTQISTTITKITTSGDSEDSESDDAEVPITIVPKDEPKLEGSPEDNETSQPDDEQSTTSSDTETTTDKDDEPDDESIDINVLVLSDDDKSATFSDKEPTSDDEKRQDEPSTVETIIVEKTHVSTSITEITTNNAPNYPANTPDDTTILVEEAAPSFEECPITDDFPKAEDIPRTENITYETAPPKYEGIVYEVSPGEKVQDSDVPSDDNIIKIPTNERESQTEDRDVCSETTQTDGATGGVSKDASSMTPTRLSSDFEIQTQVQQGSASTQTSYDEDSQWYKYTKTVEEYRKTSEKVTNRQLSDGETQTDIPSDDNLRVMTTTHEGTQTEMDDYFDESEVTRITRKTTTETRSESSYREERDTRSSRDDLKNDCPVCLQSLEATNYSFIKVKDLSRFMRMEEKHTQYEETNETSHSVCFACGRQDKGGYSSTMRDEQGERGSRRDNQGYAVQEQRDMTDGYSKTRSDVGYEEYQSGEGSTSMYERGHDEFIREGEGYSSTKREDWSYEKTTRETSEYVSSTSHEWERDVVIESESSTEVPEGAHFTLRIDGDEKCLLYCRRSGQHACALQKLASIIEAHRKATTSRTQAEDVQAQSSEMDENAEIVGEDGEGEAGTSDVIGPQRCDVSVQTDGTLLPADFEVFSDKDFEIYYDEQKSPWFV